MTGTETCFGCFQRTIEMGPERIYPGGIAVTRAMGDLVLKDPTRSTLKRAVWYFEEGGVVL